MTVRVFVDTNALVYARDASEPAKQALAATWLEYLWHHGTGRLSAQVLQEFYVTATDKLRPGLDREDARSDVRSLLVWSPVQVDARVIEGAWAIQDRYRLSWWDGLIVAAAQVAECRYLLSEDPQAHQRFGDVRVADPFLRTPEAVGLA